MASLTHVYEAPVELTDASQALFSSLQPVPADITDLIALEKRNRTLPDQLDETLLRYISEVQLDFVRWWVGGYQELSGTETDLRDQQLARLQGQVVVDLGCGAEWPAMAEFLRAYEPAAYVGIDIYAPVNQETHYQIPGFGYVTPLDLASGAPIPGAIVSGDMLEAVSQLPDGSCSFLLNGLDEDSLPMPEYRSALVAELERAVSPEGVIFGVTLAAGPLEELTQSGRLETAKIPVNRMGENHRKNFYFLAKPSADAPSEMRLAV